MNNGMIRVLLLVVLLSSCAGPMQADIQSAGETPPPDQPGAPQTGSGAASSLGTLERVHESIFHNDVEIEQTVDIFANDSLFVQGGGEGILELVDRLRLRIFNTTRMGGVTVEELPGNSLAISIFLERGGFTGELASLGSQVDFKTPGGASILIKGTRFLVVYDEDNEITTAGNFSGSMTIESAGSGPVEISPGTLRQAEPGGAPGEEMPITFNQVEYEGRARDLQSPVAALDIPGNAAVVPVSETEPPEPVQVETDTPGPNSPQLAGPPVADVIQNAFCRTGPSQVFEAEDSFVAGVRLDVDGRLADSSWWRVVTPSGRESCWISANLISLSGNLDNVPVLTSPPTPAPVPTDTPTQTPTWTPTWTTTPTEPVYVPDVPTAPGLSSPGYEDTLYCGSSDSISLDLSWSPASDADGISYYELFVEDADYGITYFDDKVFGTTTSVSLECAPSPGIHYHWIVRAVDTTGTAGPWSSDGYFYLVQVIG